MIKVMAKWPGNGRSSGHCQPYHKPTVIGLPSAIGCTEQ